MELRNMCTHQNEVKGAIRIEDTDITKFLHILFLSATYGSDTNTFNIIKNKLFDYDKYGRRIDKQIFIDYPAFNITLE